MKADLIIKSNVIFDSIAEEPFEGFIAVQGNKIAAVEKGQDPAAYIGPDTKVMEFRDKLVMAGFHDSHVHLIQASLYYTHVNLMNAHSEEECVQMVKDAVDAGQDPEGWIIGFSWYHIYWDRAVLPTAASLDRQFPDRPVFLISAEGHGAWINSKAMEIAGINKDTPDPPGGNLERDAEGNPTGFLSETAIGLAGKYAFAYEVEKEKEFVRFYMKDAVSKGITSLNDMRPYFHGHLGRIETYKAMDEGDELILRIHAASDLLGDLEEAEKWKLQCTSDKLRANLLKQFLDGVVTTHTTLMLEEFADDPGNFGTSLTDYEKVKVQVVEGHKRGFCIRLHCCGDGSARQALNFYENALKLCGKSQGRHSIEHLEVLDYSDIPRFKELGVLPSVQPEHLALTQTFAESPYPVVLGKEKGDKTWPLKSLYDTVGFLCFGSDCPVVDNNPMLEIYRAITRVHNDGEPKGGWNPTEKLTMAECLKSYTYGPAYGVCREDELGTLEAGKFADLAVIDRNLFDVDVEEIRDAKVDMTIVNGEVVFER